MFDLRDMPSPLAANLIERAATVSPATLGHFRLTGFPDGKIRPIGTPRTVAGTAVTLALPAMDSALLHHVSDRLRPGDILLIDRLGDRRHACLGGGVARVLARCGVAAAIVDGAVTDPTEIDALGLPVWARGISPVTTRVLGIGGTFNAPVSIGGAVCLAGDLVIADASGISIVPAAQARAAIDQALLLQAAEEPLLARADAGESLGGLTGASALVEARW